MKISQAYLSAPIDASPDAPVAIRVSTIPVFDGEKVVMRLLDESAKAMSLEELGFMNQGLFRVEKDLAQRYNAILARVFGYDCELEEFRIDMRGLSPEVGAHLQEKYPGRFARPEHYLSALFKIT